MKSLVLILAAVLLAYMSVSIGRMYWLAKTSGKIILQNHIYQHSLAQPKARVLFIGDSTGAGIGASRPEYSVAGRLGTKYPEADITNLSVSGIKSHELLGKVDQGQKYDLIVINIGANDVIRFKDLDQTKKNLTEILDWATRRSQQVIWYTSGKIGDAPFFAWYLKPLLNHRALKLRGVAMDLASHYQNVSYVDIVKSGKDLFSSDPERYYSIDGLHPSDYGYELWFKELQKALKPGVLE